jgi:hypothetical protein
VLVGVTESTQNRQKKEDEICTSSFSSSTIPLTSGIEEAPQLLLSVVLFYHILVSARKPLQSFCQSFLRRSFQRAHASSRVPFLTFTHS